MLSSFFQWWASFTLKSYRMSWSLAKPMSRKSVQPLNAVPWVCVLCDMRGRPAVCPLFVSSCAQVFRYFHGAGVSSCGGAEQHEPWHLTFLSPKLRQNSPACVCVVIMSPSCQSTCVSGMLIHATRRRTWQITCILSQLISEYWNTCVSLVHATWQ